MNKDLHEQINSYLTDRVMFGVEHAHSINKEDKVLTFEKLKEISRKTKDYEKSFQNQTFKYTNRMLSNCNFGKSGTSFGTKIIFDNECLKDTGTPVKIHRNKNKLSYHKRIQKKWNKKYGFVKKPVIFNDFYNNCIIAHPHFKQQLTTINNNYYK